MASDRPAPEGGFVEVAVPAPLFRPLTYRVPAALAAAAVPGARVKVPLGKRVVVGVVVGRVAEAPADVALKDLVGALDPEGAPALPPDLLATVLWAADYSVAPPGEMARAALPAAASPVVKGVARLTDAGRRALDEPTAPDALRWLAERPRGRAGTASLAAHAGSQAEMRRLLRSGFVAIDKEIGEERGAPATRIVLVPSPEAAADPDAARARLGLAPARLKLFEAALAGPPRPASELAREAGVGPAAATALVRGGLLAPQVEELPPAEAPETGLPVAPPPRLTDEQRDAVARLAPRIDANAFHAALLFGVTGSGKTEVYLRLVEHALARGRGALVLLPEIGLTPRVAEALRGRFGEGVATLHSGVDDRQRFDAWRRARDGEAKVVVGARSALFAPVRDLGLVVVDEEHDGGYKQEETPRYHARDLALVRGREAGALVVLGSATPSMEAWRLQLAGKAELVELPRRVAGGELPRAQLVDMRAEFRERGKASPFSRRLLAELQAALGRGEQAMVLLNRRGWSRAIFCRACGEAVGCPSCSVPLTWHRVGERLRCHYCGYSRPRPEACPSCSSPHLAEVGEGTQQAEQLLAAALPGARVGRLDRDAVRSPERLAELLGAFGRGDLDVLVGTQMIAKGHHFPRVTLVGALNADAALRLPDFRAAERTFQLLTQVAGRAGRGERPGLVVVQAYQPDHPAIAAALAQDFRAFAAREMAGRELLRCPPFAALANVVVRDADQGRAQENARRFAEALRAAGDGHVAVLGPTAAPLARLQGLWRVQIVVRAQARRRLNDALRRALEGIAAEEGAAPRWLVVDVDPQSLM